MAEEGPIDGLIRDTRQTAILQALAAARQGELRSKAAWETRRAFLDQLTELFHGGPLPVSKNVFVSYNQGTGEGVFNYLKQRLLERAFEVRTGFQQSPGDEGNVLGRVLGQLRQSSFYVGILTRTMQVAVPGQQGLWAPSVWTMEEKGMALAMGLPVYLLVEDGIHEDFWRKTTPERVHHRFKPEDFTVRVTELMDALLEKYEMLAYRALGAGVSR